MGDHPTNSIDTHYYTFNQELADKIKEQQTNISELQSALREIEDTVDNWRWGWDGDCGLSEKIGVMVDKALAEQP